MNPLDSAATSAELFASLFGLDGQIAVITGAGAGLGRELSRLFSLAGAHVVLADISGGAAESAAEAIRSHQRKADAVQCDITQEQSVLALFKHVQTLGGARILINNAGIYPNKPLLEMTEADWDHVNDINLKGTFLCTREAVRQMCWVCLGGRIVNVSSIASLNPALHGNTHYCASKAGVNMFTKAAALEAAEFGININTLIPGGVLTETRKARSSSAVTWRGPASDASRFLLGAAPPWKHAVGALFLASPCASHVTGQALVADGGFLIS